MNFSPNQLQNLQFRKKAFGYNEDHVNEVLDKVIEDYAIFLKENDDLKANISTLTEIVQNYRSMESNLTNSLMAAQKAAEEVRHNAFDRAEIILKDAEIKAQKLVSEASAEVVKIQREYEELKNNMKIYRLKCENLMQAQQELIKQVVEETKE